MNSDFLYLHTIIVKWLLCNEWFIQTELCIYVFHRKLNISYHEYISHYWISYFTDKTDAYFEKTWSDNSNHISDAYVMTVVYDCTR